MHVKIIFFNFNFDIYVKKEPENYTYGGAEVSDLDPSFSNRQEVAMLKQAFLEFIEEED